MNKAIILLSAGMAWILLSAANVNPAKKQAKQLKLRHMVPIADNTWMDDAEITNLHYMEFLYHQPDSLHAQLWPDTTVLTAMGPEMGQFYFSHPAYHDYPVVGISYEQAQAYCKWRTNYYQEVHQSPVRFRLPSKAEWEAAASQNSFGGPYSGSYTDPYEPASVKEQRYLRRWGVGGINSGGSDAYPGDADGHPYTNQISNTLPSNGFFGLAGNVSEMVQERGIAKGGDWYHCLQQCKVEANTPYQQPAAWLGFRCVAEVIE